MNRATNLRPKSSIMEIIFLLIVVSLIIALGFLAAFIWAIKSGQYDDDYTPSVRILFDDDKQTNFMDKSDGQAKKESDGNR